MVGENFSRVSPVESADSTSAKKRRKRKWDQPAEVLVSVGVSVPGILPVGALNSQKIQDELIAREIVINDADSAIRYKLTKRQTQEEIQRCSGAVVITRGKYHPPNVPADSEKPLYLHISAGSHLEKTVERIKAVDLAAVMVEEIMKQACIPNGAKVVHPFSISMFLGFEADPSLNIAARIRGPNDQYVNHIMNETGATVILSGHGSGNSESSFEEERKPLYLFLSSSNRQSLESAKLLAENLLDTISREFGVSRISSNIYGAVPPPQQLASVQSSGNEGASNNSLATSILIPAVNNVAVPPVSAAIHTVGLNSVPSQPVFCCYPRPSLTTGTSYYGYGGIYPEATPLQQVALALSQSPSLINSTAAQATTATSTATNSSETLSSEKERRRRKFQELPSASKESAKENQGFLFHGGGIRLEDPLFQCPNQELISAPRLLKFEVSIRNFFHGATFLRRGEPKSDSRERSVSTAPAPKKLARSAINGMPPPPLRTIPPPPPKFISRASAPEVPKNNALANSEQDGIPDTLIKLMEYGDEDDEDDETTEEPRKGDSNGLATSKPFWAV